MATSYAVSTSESAPSWLLIIFGCVAIGLGALGVVSDPREATGLFRFRLPGAIAILVGVIIVICGVVRAF
jgi:tellurite resistance protein TehA-like permease